MAVYQLFSKRQKQKALASDQEYIFDVLPSVFKVQVVHIWNDVLGSGSDLESKAVRKEYEFLVKTLCREFGLFSLQEAPVENERDYREELVQFFLAEDSVDKLLDTIELSFCSIVQRASGTAYLQKSNAAELAEASVDELNARFEQHHLGYRFRNREIMKLEPKFAPTSSTSVEATHSLEPVLTEFDPV